MVQASASAQVLAHNGHSANLHETATDHDLQTPLEQLQEYWRTYQQGDRSEAKRLQRQLQRVLNLTMVDLAEKQHDLSAIHSAVGQAEQLKLRRLEKQLLSLGRKLNKKNFDELTMQTMITGLEQWWAKR